MHGLHLLGDGGGQGGVVVSQSAGSNATDTVQIFLAIGSSQPTSLTRLDRQRISAEMRTEQQYRKETCPMREYHRLL